MAKSKQAKAREFSANTRVKIYERDREECLFCKLKYHMDKATRFELGMKSIMHYIPRSANGLGIEQNGAVGCQYHHHMFDNGPEGYREEMKEIFRNYLISFYPDWSEKELVYSKWGFLEGKK